MFTSTSASGAIYSEEAADDTGEVRDDATEEIQQTTEQSHFNPRFSGFVVRPGRCPDSDGCALTQATDSRWARPSIAS